ncbi:unannotated protein [freshwater metagenome]|uniref:Unannotated protein n=1 Tax=freshwater metagenome TaxID=449393 RepID=A0A6J6V2J3_9ZZZZ|nr:hypothetical protein [Actinomycetota bacterium]
MTSGTLRLLVWVLAAATAVLLAVTSLTLVGQWRDRAAATPAEAGPVLERHGVRLRLPAPAEVLPARERLFYADRGGRTAAAVRRAALLVPEACPAVPGSSRGFVGVVRSGGTSATAHDLQVAAWATGLGAAVGERPQEIELPDARGRRTDLVADVRVDGPCQPERVRASLVTLLADGRAATVVLVRDVGPADALDDATAELLLATVEAVEVG